MKTLTSVDADTIQQLEDRLQSLQSLLSSAPVGLCLVDCDLRFLFINDWLARINGLSVEEHIGKTPGETIPNVADAVEHAYRQVLKTRQPVLDVAIQGETAADPGVIHWWIASYYPVVGSDSGLLGVMTAVQNITPIKRVEEELRRSEAVLRQVLDLVPHMIFARDRDGHLLMANQAFADACGRPLEELIGTPHSELHNNPEQVTRMLADDRRVIRTGGARFIAEEEFTDLRGNQRTLQTFKIPFTAHASGEAAVLAVAVDVTDREETERELQRSRDQLQKLVETARVIPWEADARTWRFTYVGPQAESILGFPVEHWYESDFWTAHIHPEDREATVDFCMTSSALGGDFEFEYRMLDSHGREVWLNDLVTCEMQGGEPRILRGYMIDITHRKELEAELRRERNILQAIFDNIPMMVALLGPSGNVLKANQTFEKVLGWSPEEMKAIDILPHCYPDDATREAIMARLTPPGADWQDYKTRVRDGRTIETSWANVRLDEGMVVAIGQDITERKRAQRAVEQSRVSLERSHAEIQRLAGRLLTAQEEEHRRLARELHDDFTQRLAVLAIEAGKLATRMENSDPEAAETARQMTDQVVRLSGDLHSISRQLHPSIIEDLGLKEAIESECQTTTQRHGIQVQTSFVDLPDELADTVALCVYRVVQEGLRNITKHAGGSQATVELSAHDSTLILTVSDDGPGFDQDRAKTRAGLGLSSMEERVRLVGGSYQIESGPGAGTSIVVQIPLS